MIERGVWRKTERKRYPATEDLLEIRWYLRSREMAPTGQD